MTHKKNRLRVIPLGGLEEIGKNMTVFEYGNDMVVIDAGIMFPDDAHPGVDLILPDYSYILKRVDKLRGIIITHGHEDHTGALPYLLKDLGESVPVLGTRLTLGLIKGKLEEHGISKPKLREIRAGMHVNLGGFGFDFIAVNHSIPDSVAVVIRTSFGNILHTGDFKFDQTPVDGRQTDYQELAKLGKQGLLMLLSDSTNAETPGTTKSESVVGPTLHSIMSEADQRVIVASFASHIHRLQQVCDAAIACGRKVVVTGRSMINNVKIARTLGYLNIDDANIVDAYTAGEIPADKVCVLSTGSQGEPLSALSRMASGEHRAVQIQSGDTVIISASPVPGNEKAVGKVINRLVKLGADVFHKSFAPVHVSGHAASEELKLMLNLVNPEYFVPVHGESRHLHAHAKCAVSVGVAAEKIFIMENGECLEISDRGVRISEKVQSGVVYVDGIGVGDVGKHVLKDRHLLAKDGIVTIVLAFDPRTKKIASEIELIMRGVTLADDDALHSDTRDRIRKTLDRVVRDSSVSTEDIQRAVRDSVANMLWDRIRRRPMVVPVVMEVS
ncbi:MAG: ribonuclease J [Actinobacteria bacterium]|nr:ribonuclease J [Actinomycetota bacterium]MCL5887579.1 ribonuclease J [Actinomycetota bacterium]